MKNIRLLQFSPLCWGLQAFVLFAPCSVIFSFYDSPVLSCFETRLLAVSFPKPATYNTYTVLRLIFVIRFEIRFSQALLQKVDALLDLILSVFLWLYPKLTWFRYIPTVMEYILYLLLSLTLGIVFGLFALLWTIWLFHRNMVTHVQVAKREILARQVHLFSRLAESGPNGIYCLPSKNANSSACAYPTSSILRGGSFSTPTVDATKNGARCHSPIAFDLGSLFCHTESSPFGSCDLCGWSRGWLCFSRCSPSP